MTTYTTQHYLVTLRPARLGDTYYGHVSSGGYVGPLVALQPGDIISVGGMRWRGEREATDAAGHAYLVVSVQPRLRAHWRPANPIRTAWASTAAHLRDTDKDEECPELTYRIATEDCYR